MAPVTEILSQNNWWSCGDRRSASAFGCASPLMLCKCKLCCFAIVVPFPSQTRYNNSEKDSEMAMQYPNFTIAIVQFYSSEHGSLCRSCARLAGPGTITPLRTAAASRHITSRLVTSRHVTLHNITSHHVTSRLVSSRHITSRNVSSHHVTSRHFTSHHFTSHHVTSSHHVSSHHVTSHHVTSRLVTSHHGAEDRHDGVTNTVRSSPRAGHRHWVRWCLVWWVNAKARQRPVISRVTILK